MNTPLRTFGLNLGASPLSYDCSSLIFNDLMRSASPFSGGPNLAFDYHGWPTKVDATTGLATGIVGLNGYLPAGDYQLIARGVGTIQFVGGFNGGGWTTVNFDGSGKPITVNKAHGGVPDFNEILFSITSSQAGNPLRDIQFLLPGANGRKFYKPFLDNLHDFPTLRFMDWQHTNGCPFVNWSDRTPNHHYSISMSGFRYEEIIELANTTGKHPWICIPALASDDFIVQMARLSDAEFHKDLTIYVEYSNEVWNYGMPQWGQLGIEQVKAGSTLPLWWYIAQRDGHATNLFKANVSPNRKCLRVLARQAGYGTTMTVAMEQYKADGHGFDVMATAAYFESKADVVSAATHFATDPEAAVTEYMAGIDGGIADIAKEIAWYKQQADLAGVPLAIYEGGQSILAPMYDPATPLMIAVNRDPRMAAKYARLVASMPPGIGPFYWFQDIGAPSKWGSWGHKEYTLQPDSAAPKWQGIKRATWKQPELSSITD